jgi:hypothetical protein
MSTRGLRHPCVVDTNVAVTANGKSAASPSCVLECVTALRTIMRSGRLALDDGYRILNEYRRHLAASGQPGLGDAFFKWVHDHQADELRCQQVRIRPRADDDQSFEEFPDHPGLGSFDPADRKFVAVAAACPDGPAPILQATDSKWWGWREPLAQCGIEVRFLCEAEVSAKYRQKMG